MILPLALTDRRPEQIYQDMHPMVESALRHSMTDALNLYHEINELVAIENLEMQLPEDMLTKEGKMHVKRNPEQNHSRRFIQHIIAKKQRFDLLIKNLDYPALIMAAYPQAKLLEKTKFWDDLEENLANPVLLRGISSGKIAHVVRENQQDYYFIETGYLGNYRSQNNPTGRKVYHRIVRNEMQHTKIMDVSDDRWRSLVRFDPKLKYHGWRRGGSKILLVLPSQKPFQFFGEERESWIKTVMRTLKKHTDREIVVRHKERRGDRTESNTIYDAMDKDIYALVTYNSIAAVEAVAHGIPAFALAPTAAAPVCSNDLTQIESPVRPHPDIIYKWLCSIAYGQFTLDEMLTGQAWQMVLENNERPTFSY